MAERSRTVYLVDGTSQLFRAFFAIRGLTTADGMPTNAIYGFTTMLRKLIQDERPRYLGVAFDLGTQTFRHEEYADYKANREETPDELNVQTPYAKQVCDVLRIPVIEKRNYEADDLIATLARQAREAGFEVVVVASDKDLLQLVGDGVRVLNPSKNLMLDADEVEKTFGVRPERVLDVQGLMGDSVDNIPGVPGVGEKTAKAIVGRHGGLEDVIERAGCFVAAYDARDALLDSLAALEKLPGVSAAAAKRVADAAAALASGLERLLQHEVEDDLRGRLEELRGAIRAAAFDEITGKVGAAGREAARELRTLKKALKAIDRKSQKRVWYAIHEHAEQARLSRRLAALHAEAPVTFDPAALELGPPDRAKAEGLFASLGFRGLTAELAADGEPAASAETPAEPRQAEAVVVTDEPTLARLAKACRAEGRMAVHVEADGEDPLRAQVVGMALAHAGGAAYVPLAHDYLGAPTQLALTAVARTIGPLLADVSVAKVGFDIKRDMHLLRRQSLPVEGWKRDVMVGAFLLNSSRQSYDRATLAGELLGRRPVGVEDLTGTGAKRRDLRELEVERVAAYAAGGAAVTLELADAVEARLAETELVQLYERIDGPLLPLLARMEARGIRVDTELLGSMSAEMESSLDLARLEIHALAGADFNIDSPKQLREVLFDRLGLKPRRKTAKGKVASTDAQTLEELADEHEIAAKILEYRELAKLKGTYVDALPRLVHPETGRVHTSFRPTGAATGRLSSVDPNLQNIPARTPAGRRIRRAFVPDPGNVFLAADYSQIELRVLAHLCEDEQLIRAFREGQDIHRATAAVVGGVLPDLVTADMRRRAKAVNFGILYGMSEIRLAREQGMSRTEARAFIRAYFERFSAVRQYIDGVRDRSRHEGKVRTLFGRIRYFPQLHQRVNRGVQEQALRAAVNTTVQGTAADLMKLAMLRVDAALAEAGLRDKILLQVHDELLLEVHEGEADRAGDLVRRAMETVHPLRVPLVVDRKVGTSWEEVT